MSEFQKQPLIFIQNFMITTFQPTSLKNLLSHGDWDLVHRFGANGPKMGFFDITWQPLVTISQTTPYFIQNFTTIIDNFLVYKFRLSRGLGPSMWVGASHEDLSKWEKKGF